MDERIQLVRTELEEISKKQLQELHNKLEQDSEKIREEMLEKDKILTDHMQVLKSSLESLEKKNEELEARNAELEEKIALLESSFSALTESHNNVIEYLKTMGIHYEEKKTTKDIFNDFLADIRGKSGSDAMDVLQGYGLSAKLVESGYSAVRAKTLKNDLKSTFLSSDRITDEVMVKIRSFFQSNS
ncbi:MAG: hypothetical protein ACFFD4_38810 [Candidatus Odinarchaeota archaeon]